MLAIVWLNVKEGRWRWQFTVFKCRRCLEVLKLIINHSHGVWRQHSGEEKRCYKLIKGECGKKGMYILTHS